jgi:predicted unusual protein kinase regulating ubiquinone biosynthesis (AarF/ABC1/UbiB family)
MNKQKTVPSSRLSRLTSLGSLVSKVAVNVVVDRAKQWSKGQSPSVKDLLIQPKNIESLADKLSELRGAAMKVGQMLSMDAGDLLPPALSQLLDKLRSNAVAMPHKQLIQELEAQWGKDWLNHFAYFDLKPFSSASIGQVHIAHKDNGKKLAVKVQYKGVAKAISSDVDNVALLLKLSGLLPKHINIDSLLEEAKAQLLMEADYLQEASFINNFRGLMIDKEFVLPEVDKDLSTQSILVMNFIEGVPIDKVETLDQAVRNKVVESLIGLFFEELFSFQLMQTDPNFANYLFQIDTGKIVLLDFGATRKIPTDISIGYLALINSGVQKDENGMIKSARNIGFFKDDIDPAYLTQVLGIFKLACEPLINDENYDFASSGLAERIKEKGLLINSQQEQWHTPPIDAVFIHRKLAGLYLLAAKLKANINIHRLFDKYATKK